ncbi:hypothetical protein PGH12_01450 [Chryseobacterium wangxinyae]|uniref:hypothetical protein n=1 Tax=Chryseobacterium sp. CY350 TaxID=2997336 RepID=UPI00226E1A46|nr:hypothetical protein [Chryseobacterium sp. CY350]MCY0977153.1 hypothetical protein [Chryseobacterium sp. CY350]WBZ95826.1 hypothetical protein PGH12_01450 [Chryseobacterium sp. CY350]
MTYLQLIHQFWDFNHKYRIGSTGISMYLYLLKIGFKKDQPEFQLSDGAVSEALSLTRKTVKATREKLYELGLIDFKSRNGLPCSYVLLLNYSLSLVQPGKREKIRVDKKSAPRNAENYEHLPALPKSGNFRAIKDIPTFDEFTDFARTLSTYRPEIDSCLEKKYKAWLENGWQSNSDRLITNWKSSLKNILPYINNEPIDHQLSMRKLPHVKLPKDIDRNKL